MKLTLSAYHFISIKMNRILTMLSLLITLNISAQKIKAPGTIAAHNRDAFLLALMVRDHLKETDALIAGLATILQRDSTGRITTCFEKTDLKSKKGHISLYFKFSSLRDEKAIQLTAEEKKLLGWMRYQENKSLEDYDGEIQFDYGERFYRIRKIIVKKK